MTALIENSFAISTKLLKKDLYRAREQKTGINGFINISYGNTKAVADYSIELGTEYDYLVIQYGEKEQRIKLAESELHFGTRSWFICECERRVAKLYLPPHTTKFKCRRCHSLSYELQSFNKNSKHGHLMYITNRTIKLMSMRERMRSIFYAGKLTIRFNRFLRLSDVLGLENNRKDARVLLLALKT